MRKVLSGDIALREYNKLKKSYINDRNVLEKINEVFEEKYDIIQKTTDDFLKQIENICIESNIISEEKLTKEMLIEIITKIVDEKLHRFEILNNIEKRADNQANFEYEYQVFIDEMKHQQELEQLKNDIKNEILNELKNGESNGQTCFSA